MTARTLLLTVSLLAPLGLATAGTAHAQVAVDEDKSSSSSSTSGSPASSSRMGDLLGNLGAPVTEPEKSDAPDVPERTHDSVRRCFKEAAKREVSLPGRVEVEFTLYNFGVTKVSLPDASGMDLLLRECVQGAIKGADVEAKDGSYTWLFIPSAG